MYTEDDTMTPRDRISDDMLRRLLDSENGHDRLHSSGNRRAQDNAQFGTQNGAQNGCGSQETGFGLHDYPLASVYAPLQHFRKIYDTKTALDKGTMFSELDLPFMGASVANDCSQGKGGCRG